MDGPAWATGASAALVLTACGAGGWRLRERVSVRWAIYGTFVAPAAAELLLVVAFLAVGGQVGPR